MRLVELPRYIPLSVYQEQIDRMTCLLRRDPNVVAIYQVGSVGTPGVSDADLWVVFRDGATCDFDHRAGLDSDGRYIFTHGLFGICQSHFLQSLRFQFFHNFKLLFGDDLSPGDVDTGDLGESDFLVEQQAALEYVINAYQVSTVEQAFGVASVRNLLLYAKALLMDVGPLGVERCSSGLKDVLTQIMSIREGWFDRTVNAQELSLLHKAYGTALRSCLHEYFRENTFWYPHGGRIELRGNISMTNGPVLGEQISGISLPSWLTASHKRLRNLQRRFKKFEFVLPMSTDAPCAALKDRFELIRQAQEYNRAHLSHFMPLPVGLSIFDLAENSTK